VDFEWDDAKREETIAKRNLDFADAFLFFDGRPVIHQPTPRDGEERWKSTASFDGKFFTLVWTWRTAAIRVISMRRSHAQEERRHRSLFPG
jgi:uncharacterized protein